MADDWKTRLQREISELDIRMVKLEAFIEDREPSDPDFHLLMNQLTHMNDYMNDLIARCICYGIDVKRPRFEKQNDNERDELSDAVYENYVLKGGRT